MHLVLYSLCVMAVREIRLHTWKSAISNRQSAIIRLAPSVKLPAGSLPRRAFSYCSCALSLSTSLSPEFCCSFSWTCSTNCLVAALSSVLSAKPIFSSTAETTDSESPSSWDSSFSMGVLVSKQKVEVITEAHQKNGALSCCCFQQISKEHGTASSLVPWV
ncbi:hypothetical protein GQ54DRAFT_17487 [Martensiomyces pterosporus]|nr:hypothetical protein GQ54DRAFT_17487 [Martensiomyces pterosporus]